MNVLIVQSCAELGLLWQRHMERHDMRVTCTATESGALAHLANCPTDIIVLDLVIDEGAALAVSDYANYRWPDAKVVFVTDTTFFSDGSIFAHCANARAFLPSSTRPEDLAAIVEHCGAQAG